MRQLLWALAIAAACSVRAEDPEPPPPPIKTIEGAVIDMKNVLQPDADIAPPGWWTFGAGTLTPPEKVAFKADAKGRFSRKEPWTGPVSWFAVDKARTKGGFVTVEEAMLEKPPIVVRLGALMKVKGRLASPMASIVADGAWFTVSRADGVQVGAGTVAPGGGFDLRLPVGKYKLAWNHANFDGGEKEFDVLPGKLDLALGEIPIVPTMIATCDGKPLPKWTAVEGRRIDPATQIDAFRGKWVLLEFWGAWCTACQTWVIPRLAKWQERHQEYADKFVILAFHDSTQKTLDEADVLLDKVTKGEWNTKTLPFPVLLDAPENGTCKTWGVRGYPKLLLIDPDGVVVPGGDEKMLHIKLTGETPAK